MARRRKQQDDTGVEDQDTTSAADVEDTSVEDAAGDQASSESQTPRLGVLVAVRPFARPGGSQYQTGDPVDLSGMTNAEIAQLLHQRMLKPSDGR